MRGKRGLYLCIHMMAFILLPSQSPPAFAITTDELADLCEAMESAFTDISVEYEWGVQRPSRDEPPIAGALMSKGSTKGQWSTKRPFGERSLVIERGTVVDERGNPFESTTMQSYDGRTAKHLSSGGLLPDGAPVNISIGTITESRNFMPPANQTPLAFSVLRLSYVNNDPVPLYVRLRNSELVHFDSVTQKINGFNAVRTDLLMDHPTAKPKPPEIRVYFSVDHGYTPVKYEYMSMTAAGPEPSFVVDVNELREVSGGLWFPSSGSMTMVQTNLINTYRASSIAVNQALTDSDFDITFPPGTRVSNEVTGTRYVMSSAEDQLNTSMENAKANDAIQKRREQKAEPKSETEVASSKNDSQKSKGGMFIYIAAGAIVAGLLTVLVMRKYR
jgi:hypothetical protein